MLVKNYQLPKYFLAKTEIVIEINVGAPRA